MSKKLLSVLVVLALALSMIPVVGLPATEANAASDVNKNLSFKADGKTAYCPHCKADVEWTDVNAKADKRVGGVKDGAKGHYYLSDNLVSNAKGDDQKYVDFIQTEGAGTEVCFHLNGKNLTYYGLIRVFEDSKLNVMGNGKVVSYAVSPNSNYNARVLWARGTVTVYGGTWSIGDPADGDVAFDAAYTPDTAANPNSILILTGTTRIAGLVNAVKNCSRVTLGQEATMDQLQVTNSAKLTVEGTWTGNATITKDPTLTNWNATGNYTGKLLYDTDGIGVGTTRGYFIANGTTITKVLACIGDKWYGSLAKAVEAYTEQDFKDGKVITVHCDASQCTTVAGQSYYIDLNGFEGALNAATTEDTTDRVPIMINGAGTVYLLDSANDTYKTDNMGRAALGEGSTATIKEDVTVGGKRYLTLKKDNEYSAHRLTLDVTDAVLRTSENGLFFKAEIKADSVLGAMIKSCGVVVSKTDAPESVVATDNAFTKLDFVPNSKGIMYTNSALVKNIFKDAADATNKTRGETKIYAKAYVTLQKDAASEAVELFGEGVSASAADVLKAIDTKWSSYNAKAQANAKSFFAQWKGKGASGNRIEDLGLTNIK